jgi:hypothetical protein
MNTEIWWVKSSNGIETVYKDLDDESQNVIRARGPAVTVDLAVHFDSVQKLPPLDASVFFPGSSLGVCFGTLDTVQKTLTLRRGGNELVLVAGCRRRFSKCDFCDNLKAQIDESRRNRGPSPVPEVIDNNWMTRARFRDVDFKRVEGLHGKHT